MTRFPVLERHFPVLERPFLLCPVWSRGTGQDRLSKSHTIPSRPASHPGFWQAVPARPGPWQDFEIVPLALDNEGTSVPLSRKVALSRPVENPTPYPSDFQTSCWLCSYLLTIAGCHIHTLTTTHLRNPKFFKTSLHIWRLITADEKCFTSLTNVLC